MTAASLRMGLLDAPGPSLRDHLATFGRLPAADATELAQASGLTGRGGAAFPTAVKLRSVAAARAPWRSPVVVGNAAEGEPASAKDATLLEHAPHLVLDGLQLVADTLDADDVVLAVPGDLMAALGTRLAERRDGRPVRLHAAGDRFLAGEESALVAAINGAEPLPTSKVPPVRERGVRGRPTLVQNVETLARLALLARGEDGAATRALVTRRVEAGGHPAVDVADVPLHTRLGELLPIAAGDRAVLVGGYHGTWLPAAAARTLRLDPAELSAAGAALGAGVLAVLPADRCGLRETARVVRYLAAESAGQCGPCLNGLPRIAAALDLIARPGPVPRRVLADVRRWSQLVAGRGACRHPDGSVHLVTSALRVFSGEVSLHASGRCSATSSRPFLPVPGRSR